MDDMISRRAALDALRKMQTYKLFSGDDMLLIDQAGAQTELMLLPSAQLATDKNVGTELGTNLAEVGTDCISRQSAIDALRKLREEDIEDYGCEIPEGFNQDHLDRATFAINQLPSAQPEIIYCKDCRKQNKRVGFDENFHTVWKEDACPIETWRGKAQGHEFDYQFCAYAERREVTT